MARAEQKRRLGTDMFDYSNASSAARDATSVFDESPEYCHRGSHGKLGDTGFYLEPSCVTENLTERNSSVSDPIKSMMALVEKGLMRSALEQLAEEPMASDCSHALESASSASGVL